VKELLLALLERPQIVLTRDQLLDATRGRFAGPFDRAIDMQVGRLRRKIEADAKNPTLIKTVRGGGYVLAAMVERRQCPATRGWRGVETWRPSSSPFYPSTPSR
jgi:two-component system OmpR family response regulator